MFEEIIACGRKLTFHTPNAVRIRAITPELARLMRCRASPPCGWGWKRQSLTNGILTEKSGKKNSRAVSI
ncbi:MAG: hypothetical protein R2860_11640 [Desulfobacterales bacterium]